MATEPTLYGHDHSRAHEKSLTREITLVSLSGLMFFSGLFVHWLTANPAFFPLYQVTVKLSALLYGAAVIFGGIYTARRGVKAVLSFPLSIDFLVTVAMIGKTVEAASLAFLDGVISARVTLRRDLPA